MAPADAPKAPTTPNRKVNWIRAKVWLPDGMDSSDILWD
jgi:hypothetical protein